ncbi:MAG TPA: alpha/beta hydrolase [Methanomicrobiales archaeon]|nr:alpha/beta hydrolase [Methanomicrobiales archaeon]
MRYPLGDRVLLVRGDRSFLLAGRALSAFPLYIETFDEELSQPVSPGDLVAVSAPEGGDTEPARMLLELVRRYHLPLLVLPKGHPGSGRLPLVVSVAGSLRLACDIRRGTHPDQHLICSSDELAGITLESSRDGVEVSGAGPGVRIGYLG